MRVVVLGCGTGVGKTRVSVALLRALSARGLPALGLKPIESGVSRAESDLTPPVGSDAAQLSAAGTFQTPLPHPLYALREPISPHLAARRSGVDLSIGQSAAWVANAEALASRVLPRSAVFTVVESAGGVFSPLGPNISNFDLARALDPAIWVLVAADALGVLHDVSSTLKAMRSCGRAPNHLVLSAAREPDASTGSNAPELTTLGIAKPSATLARDDDGGIDALLDRLVADAESGTAQSL